MRVEATITYADPRDADSVCAVLAALDVPFVRHAGNRAVVLLEYNHDADVATMLDPAFDWLRGLLPEPIGLDVSVRP